MRGFVVDSADGVALPGVTVFLEPLDRAEQRPFRTATDGLYVLARFPPDRLRDSFVGYETHAGRELRGRGVRSRRLVEPETLSNVEDGFGFYGAGYRIGRRIVPTQQDQTNAGLCLLDETGTGCEEP